ncbi:YT521-B-like domain-containing protein [Hypoxylon fuscum]|nr:YT521-B-like domain-containing protein [Hypoxylon fuscum]
MSSSRQNDDYRDGEYGSKSYRSYRNTQDRGSHREDYSAVSPIEHHSSPHPSPTTPSSPKHSRKNLSELSNQLPYTPSHPRVRDLKDNMGPPITKSSYRSRGHDRARSTSNGYEMTHSSPVRARGYVDETKTSSDVRDWLKLTGWHDEDFRSQKLAEFRTEMRAEEEQHAINAVTEGMSGSHKGATEMRSEGRSFQRGRAGGIDYRSSRDRSASPHRSTRPTFNRTRDYHHSEHGQPSTSEETPPGRYDQHGPKVQLAVDERDSIREYAHTDIPKPLSLDNDEIRFFVIRSFSWSNIYDAMDDGVWATQLANVAPLSEAFLTAPTVVLFFSVNGSHGIQGYAVMKSLPSEDVVRPKWWKDIKMEVSEPFELEWFLKVHVDNKHFYYILNSLNEGLPVTRARDGQEISNSAGRQLKSVLENRATAQIEHDRRQERLAGIGHARQQARLVKDD